MRIGVILVIIGAAFMVIGGLFKIQHWPLAGLFLICGYLLWPVGLLIVLVSTLYHTRFVDFLNTRLGPIKARPLVHVLIGFTLLAVVANIGALFKIQHWPLTGPVWLGLAIVAAVLVWMFMRYSNTRNSVDG